MPDDNGNRDSYETQKMPKLEIKSYLQETSRDIIMQVYEALEEKGYNPINQLTGYILSGDPTYITSHRDARKRITRVERDELLEELLTFYLFDQDRS